MTRRHRRASATSLGLMLLLAGSRDALAGEDDATDLHADFALDGYEFLEPQYFLLSPQKISVNGDEDPLTFEAQLAVHAALYGRRIGTGSVPDTGFVVDTRLLFTFLSRLRMTGDESSPVVTPSYMPRLRFQVLGRRRFREDVEIVLGGTAMVAHHSNGQQGCTLRNAAGETTMLDPDGSEVCLPPERADFLNEDGGSFSTNYYGVTLNLRASFDAQPKRRSPSLYLTITAEHHPKGFLPAGALDDDLFNLWGNLHFDAQVEGRLPLWLDPSTDTHRLEPYALLEYYWANKGKDSRLPMVAVDHGRRVVEAGIVFPKLFRLGLFVRGVFGREYYNIQFSQSVSRFQAGIVLDTSFGSIAPLVPRSTTFDDVDFPPPDD